MDVIAAYREVGSYRGAAAICGTTPKTVKRVVARHEAGGVPSARRPRGHNYDAVTEVVAKRVGSTHARISAKRLLPEARAAGYTGSARNFRRLVGRVKRTWRRDNQRGRRPGCGRRGRCCSSTGAPRTGCTCSLRFVRFAADERAETTFELLAECFEVLGGVPKVVLADRMGCLKGGVVANVVVPTPAYVGFATHFGFRPDFCEAADPESKGMVENLVGYAKRDLLVPQAPFGDLTTANASASGWCAEVNGVEHSEIRAVPAQRLDEVERALLAPLPSLRPRIGKAVLRKVDRLSCVRVGSARYSVPTTAIGTTVEVVAGRGRIRVVHPATGELLAEHALVAPGEASVADEHYGGPRPAPRRAARPKTAVEKAFFALGEVAEQFVKGAAAAGVPRLASELAEILALEAAHGREQLTAALGRAVAFGRYRAGDVRSILAAGAGAPQPRSAGETLAVELPKVPTRPLSAYRLPAARTATDGAAEVTR